MGRMRDQDNIQHDGRTVREILGDDRADLRDADLRDAYLRGADLRGAYLRDADLRGADLRGAYLRNTDLRGADLRGAYLRNTDLRGADLRGADLRDAVPPSYERIPEDGTFTAYKGCTGNVVKLEIPHDADRTSSLIGPKCRAEYANVTEVLDATGEPCDATSTTGWYDKTFEYIEGDTVYPDSYDDDIRVQCTNGIHFYPTKREAIDAVR